MKAWGRKFTIFVIIIIVGVATTFFMDIKFYSVFIDNLFKIAVAFFVGNGIEHVSQMFRKDK